MGLHLGKTTSLHWCRFGDEWVVYNEGSGETIAVDGLTAAGLMTLDCKALDQGDLVCLLAEDLGIADRDRLAVLIDERMQGLKSLGWIESEH